MLPNTLCDIDRIGSMYPKEYPKDLIGSGSGLYPMKAVVLFFGAKTALHTGGPFLVQYIPELFLLPGIFGGPPLWGKVVLYPVQAAVCPVGIGGIDDIGGECPGLDMGRGLGHEDRTLQSGGFIEGIKA